MKERSIKGEGMIEERIIKQKNGNYKSEIASDTMPPVDVPIYPISHQLLN